MVRVAGVDACKQGWVAVLVDDDQVEDVLTFASFRPLLSSLSDRDAIGVDIPIGMPQTATRRADREARRFVGSRAPSVFDTPPRAVLEAPTYEEARNISLSKYGRGVSAQSYRLREKLLDVDRARSGHPIFEVHPEVSFCGLAGKPLAHNKRSWNGQMLRRRLLMGAGLALPDELDDAAAVAVDDVLDAAVVAWSAMRIARGAAISIPEPPEDDERGYPMAIWY